MKTKYLILNFITLFMMSTAALAQSNYSKGFQEGYKKGYCYGEFGCIPPIPPITPIAKIGESETSYTDGYNRGFILGQEDKKKSTTSNSSNNQDRQRYRTSQVQPVDHIYNQPNELILRAALAARQQYERNEQIQKEKAINLMNQVKSYYNQLESYPPNIKNGWYKVIAMNNSDFCEERKVYVESNKVTKYVIDDCINGKISYPALINNAKATVQLMDDDGSIADMVEVYFIEYISNPMSSTTPPIQSGKISFWTNWKKSGSLRLFFDGEYIGTFTQYFENGFPSCGQEGTLTVEYKPGTYKYVAVSGSKRYEGMVTITAGQCSLYCLKK